MCEKIETIGRAVISSKFYNCGCSEGEGTKALQLIKMIKVFQREELAEKGTAVKLWEASRLSFDRPLPGKPLDIPARPLHLEQFFHSFREVKDDGFSEVGWNRLRAMFNGSLWAAELSGHRRCL